MTAELPRHRQPLLFRRIQRRLRPVIAIYWQALLVWIAWASLSAILWQAFAEAGLFVSLLSLGALTLAAVAYCARRVLWILRVQRVWEARNQHEFSWWTRRTIQTRRPLPLWETRMARPELLAAVWKFVVEERPCLALELGSGLSTLVIAYALEEVGEGEVISLEDHRGYAARTRRLLSEHGLSDYAQVLDAPLAAIRIDGEKHYWYSTEGLPGDMAIDLLLIDGPGTSLAGVTRYPSLPVLRRFLAKDALVIVDDVDRPRDQANINRWRTEFPELRKDNEASGAYFSVFRLCADRQRPDLALSGADSAS